MANIIPFYEDNYALTISLGGLASDHTNLLAGRESTEISNTSSLDPDVKLAGQIRAGTSPTAGNQIEIWAWASTRDSPLTVARPDSVVGSDAAITLTSANTKRAALKLVKRITVDATSNRIYSFSDVSVARLFNGVPRRWGIIVINASGVALHATGADSFITAKPDGFSVT